MAFWAPNTFWLASRILCAWDCEEWMKYDHIMWCYQIEIVTEICGMPEEIILFILCFQFEFLLKDDWNTQNDRLRFNEKNEEKGKEKKQKQSLWCGLANFAINENIFFKQVRASIYWQRMHLTHNTRWNEATRAKWKRKTAPKTASSGGEKRKMKTKKTEQRDNNNKNVRIIAVIISIIAFLLFWMKHDVYVDRSVDDGWLTAKRAMLHACVCMYIDWVYQYNYNNSSIYTQMHISYIVYRIVDLCNDYSLNFWSKLTRAFIYSFCCVKFIWFS